MTTIDEAKKALAEAELALEQALLVASEASRRREEAQKEHDRLQDEQARSKLAESIAAREASRAGRASGMVWIVAMTTGYYDSRETEPIGVCSSEDEANARIAELKAYDPLIRSKDYTEYHEYECRGFEVDEEMTWTQGGRRPPQAVMVMPDNAGTKP